jgi:hypothetical protein
MGQRLKKTSLFFGQVAGGQQPAEYKSTLSGLYGDVGAGQTEAVKTLGQQVQQKTQGLAGALGLEQKVSDTEPDKITTTLTDKFRPTVDISKGVPSTTPGAAATPIPSAVSIPTKAEGETDEDYLKKLNAALTAAGTNIEDWKKSGKSAEDYLKDVLKSKQEAAGKAATEAQEQVTEKKLGARPVVQSELEKQASSYQNILASSPGTSNVGAVANLMKFYDTTKYKTLEAGIRQGETALARQEAIKNVGEMSDAERARATAIGEYSKQARELGQTLQQKVGEAGEAESKRLSDYFGAGQTAAEKAKSDIEGEITKTTGRIETKAKEDFSSETKKATENQGLTQIDNILKAIKGRAGDNWLNTRGSEVLEPLRTKMAALRDQIDVINQNPSIDTKTKTDRMRTLNTQINDVQRQVAGELTAFLGDTNTKPGDALDAAEQIAAAGLIDLLSEDQKNVIRNRIEKDIHFEERDKNRLSSPEKLLNIYNAFGGTKDLTGDIIKKQLGYYIG